jgi:UDP:flavonoid glycosyltransferase YjiC (YdhE family)
LLGERMAAQYFPKALPWVFRYFAAPLNKQRRRAGLAPLGDLLDVLSFGDFVLYADPPEMVDMHALPSNHRFLGAIAWSAKGEPPESWGRAEPPVYVTMGSSGAERCVPVVLDALSGFPVDVLLATAGKHIAGSLPKNVRAVPFVDGAAACARAGLVVHNGGSSTGYQALRAGKPVLGIPSNLDQYLASARIDAKGAGLSLRSGALQADAVAAAVGRLLGESQFRSNAESLRDSFSRHDAEENFRQFVGQAL